MSEFERLPILDAAGAEISHLSFRVHEPAGAKAPLCLVFLHGFGSDQEGEKAQFLRERALENGLAFCTFDFRGHGKSGDDMRGLTIDRNIEDLKAIQAMLAGRGHDRLGLIGSSMGGFTAIWHSALSPDGIACGMHIAPAFGMDEGFLLWAGPEKTMQWQKDGVVDFGNDFVSCELGWGWIADLKSRQTARLLPLYKTPTLILQGKHDESVPWRGVLAFATQCRYEGIDLHLFADGDHRLTDRKDRLWDLMWEFLRGRGLLCT